MSARSTQIRRSWDDNASAWLDAVHGKRIESRRVATDAAMVEAVTALQPRRMLDVGCGEGWLCRALGARAVHAVGIDACAALVDAARARDASQSGSFHQADYLALSRDPLAFGRFDAALCNFALFEDDVEPLLGALASLLEPDGTLLIQTLHPVEGDVGGWREERFTSMGPAFTTPMPWYQRSRAAWLECLAAAGFGHVHSQDVNHPQSGAPLSLLLRARL